MKQPIYLDYQATTPLAPEVFEAMLPWLKDNFANPHSAHRLGRQAAAAVEVAREQVAALMPSGGNVIFTGSATEAINMAFGTVGQNANICCSAIEHAAVLDTAQSYKQHGHLISEISVGTDGLIDSSPEIFSGADLVAVMLVNNEIGTIQDIDSIAVDPGSFFLCDAVQGYGRVPIPNNVDLVAISAHKIHGPKGIGALWVREGVEVPPMIFGGGQEAGIRSGTLSPALCAGLGAAAKLAEELQEQDRAHIESLASEARQIFRDWTINGSTEQRYPGNLNIRRDGLDVGRLMSDVRAVAFSAGSACASGSGRPSHVLKALGLSGPQIKSSIRLGFGRYTTVEEIREAGQLINAAAETQLA